MKYTEKIHAKNLLRILDMQNICDICPAHTFDMTLSKWDNDTCEICNHFIRYEYTDKCPCEKGKARTIKRSWKALEDKGYI